MRIACGPFDPNDPGSDWPVCGSGTLAPEFEIVPFKHSPNVIEGLDALVVWSPEYVEGTAKYLSETFDEGMLVAVVGDWHIVPFEDMPWLANYDLICADKRGIKRLTELGYDPSKLLYFRQFSFDPRLHFQVDDPRQRDIDVAFMGRDVPVRRPFLEALQAWGQKTGRRVHIETNYPRGREADIYRRSKIVFNYSQRGEINMRAYEAAACGALGVLQHAALAEVIAAGAGIPTYPACGQSTAREIGWFLDGWLGDSAARDNLLAKQQEWVQTETPAAHLGWLCRQIASRLPQGGRHVTPASRISTRDAGPGSGEPSPSDQRPECVRLVPESARKILDIGCGTGGVGWALRQRNPAVEVTGVDAEPRFADLARERLTRFVQAGVEVPDDHPLWAALKEYGPYDAVLCLDSLEHFFDPWAVLKRLRPLLAEGGVLVASVPNIRNAANLHELAVGGRWRYFRHGQMDFRGPADNICSFEHVRFFTRDSLAALFQECGYRVERWEAAYFAEPAPDSPLERWVRDLRLLAVTHGADARRLDEELLVMQWLCVCRPEWGAMV